EVFDGIFDGEDMPGFLGGTVLDHGGQGGGFAGTGGAHHQDQPPGFEHQVFQLLGQTQVFDAGDVRLEVPDHHTDLAPLIVDIDAKAPQPGDRDGEVALQVGLQIAFLLVAHHAVNQGLDG